MHVHAGCVPPEHDDITDNSAEVLHAETCISLRGVMKVVSLRLSPSKGVWWYPLRASNMVKNLALECDMSATASAGVPYECTC